MTLTNPYPLTCVMFDLDGTLVDTAPDLIACLNQAFAHYGLSPVRPDQVKPFISFGGEAMINEALNGTATKALKSQLLMTMYELYQNNIAEHTVFYEGMVETLTAIEKLGLKWGVITNKRERFTRPLLKALQLDGRTACIVSGDTTAYGKPHPEPMLEACKQAGVKPCECAYIGDAQHDIRAGKNVDMKTLAAVYGYLKPDDNPESWGADALIASPKQLLDWIGLTLCR